MRHDLRAIVAKVTGYRGESFDLIMVREGMNRQEFAGRMHFLR